MRALRILIVEDEDEVRGVLAEYLAGQGHAVVAVPSGQGALALVKGEGSPFDVAVVDWNLPGITGRDVIASIRAASPRTRVLISTGEIQARFRPGHAQASVVYKPYSLRDLHDRVVSLVEGSAGGAADA